MANNVFQMLAQQEIDERNAAPQRRLADLQLQQQQMLTDKMRQDEQYQQGMRTAMQGPSLSSLGQAGQAQQPAAQPSIVDQFRRQYEYHVQNGRPDLAQKVMMDQVDLSTKAAGVATQVYKTGGKEGLAQWLQANPTFAPLLGDPAQMQFDNEGVLFPATDEKGQPVPGMFWHRGENGQPVFKEIKPQGVAHVPEGAAVPDGKGGWVIPAPKSARPDAEALIDKRFANQLELQRRQQEAADRRTDKQISAAAERGMRTANGPGKILPAGQLESIADMKRVKDVMAEARQILMDKKVDTGPVSGRLQSLGSKVGMASDQFVDVQQRLQTAENIMLKLRSGAAVTESEYQRFKKEFPRTSDSPAVMQRKMNNALAYANTLMDSKLDIYEEGGYRIPASVKSGGKPAPAQQQPKQGQTKKGGRFTIIEVK